MFALKGIPFKREPLFLALKGIPHVKYEKNLLTMPVSLVFSQDCTELGPNFTPRPLPL